LGMNLLGRVVSLLKIVSDVLYAFLKSLCWNFLSSAAGLFQVFIILLFSVFINNMMSLGDILKSGIILFFCSAFVSASVIDYWFMRKKFFKNKISGFVEVVFIYAVPLLVILLIASVYSGLLLSDEKNIDMAGVLNLTIICFTIAVGHSLIYRSLYFYFRRS